MHLFRRKSTQPLSPGANAADESQLYPKPAAVPEAQSPPAAKSLETKDSFRWSNTPVTSEETRDVLRKSSRTGSAAPRFEPAATPHPRADASGAQDVVVLTAAELQEKAWAEAEAAEAHRLTTEVT